MKHFSIVAFVALSILFVSCQKQPSQPEKQTFPTPASSEMSALRTALTLAKYGYREQSPSALIEAANIMISTPQQPLTVEGTRSSEDKAEAKPMKVIEPAVILADAKEMADGDEMLLAMADKVLMKMEAQWDKMRGSFDGPKRRMDYVSGKGQMIYNIPFRAGEIGEVTVLGSGDTDLDLFIYDANGGLINSDTNDGDDCYARFAPRMAGNVTIKIVNRGTEQNDYSMITN